MGAVCGERVVHSWDEHEQREHRQRGKRWYCNAAGTRAPAGAYRIIFRTGWDAATSVEHHDEAGREERGRGGRRGGDGRGGGRGDGGGGAGRNDGERGAGAHQGVAAGRAGGARLDGWHGAHGAAAPGRQGRRVAQRGAGCRPPHRQGLRYVRAPRASTLLTVT